MTKSDPVLHSFTIYEIKKATFKPYDFKWTKFHENNSDFVQLYPEIQLDVEENELIICSTVIDADNFSILTTRRIVTKENGIEDMGYMAGATTHDYPFYVGHEKFNYIFGTVVLPNGNAFRHFIEAGKACAMMIYGIKTLIWTQQLTDSQMVNLVRIWEKKRKANL